MLVVVTRGCCYLGYLVVKLWCNMEPPGGRDSRFNLGYSMNLLSGETAPEIYGNPNLGRPSTSLQQLSPRHTMVSSACGGRAGLKSDMYDERAMPPQGMGLEACGVNDISSEDAYGSLQSKKSPPSNGKKTKGRVKIKMEYIENKLRRYTTFSKRKTGIMKKAYELSTLTGTQVMLLVASETGHVYTFATRKLQPMITSEAGKALIQTCLNSPDPPAGSAGGDQRMSATGFEETELTYNISDEDSKADENGFDGYSSTSDEDDAMEDTSDVQEQNHASDPVIASIKERTMKDHQNLFESRTKYEKKPDTCLSKDKQKVKPTASSKVVLENAQEKTVASSVSNPAALAVSTATTTPAPTPPLLTPLASGSGSNLASLSLPATSLTGNHTVLAPSQIQAVPLLVQTPAGVGYATTPDGMILGLLQGPNISQPQLVAIPMNSTAVSTSNSGSTSQSNKKSNGSDKS